MSVNKYRPHVWLIPEDDANRQLANGFLLHAAVDDAQIGVRAPAGGWGKVLEVFESEYLSRLRSSSYAHVVMLIDFDNAGDRRAQFEQAIPDDVRPRVFVVGAKHEPETLKRELGRTLENIGLALAEDCSSGDFQHWRHPHLIHNDMELARMVGVVKPFLFR